jgi:hypothetical protein
MLIQLSSRLGKLDEARKIIERLGLSDTEGMYDYALTLSYSGEANRALGNGRLAAKSIRKPEISIANLALPDRAQHPC